MVAMEQDMLPEQQIQMVMAVFMDEVVDEVQIVPVKTVDE